MYIFSASQLACTESVLPNCRCSCQFALPSPACCMSKLGFKGIQSWQNPLLNQIILILIRPLPKDATFLHYHTNNFQLKIQMKPNRKSRQNRSGSFILTLSLGHLKKSLSWLPLRSVIVLNFFTSHHLHWSHFTIGSSLVGTWYCFLLHELEPYDPLAMLDHRWSSSKQILGTNRVEIVANRARDCVRRGWTRVRREWGIENCGWGNLLCPAKGVFLSVTVAGVPMCKVTTPDSGPRIHVLSTSSRFHPQT
jgi:hypothetical protein